MRIINAEGKGEVFYGMHFYPGVAEYQEPGKDPFRIFINEDIIRKMNPSFAGRPIFVEHVEDVDGDINQLRTEADGWVVESFFNQADGKTWAKFIIVSDYGLNAIRNGFRLSNAYIPKSFAAGGIWNGVSYARQVMDGEYEHLAIVRNPRYEESVILTPEEFKAYNEEKTIELKRLANSKDQKGDKMKFNIFKKTKVENSLDLSEMLVELPVSKKEISLTKVINEYDKIVNMNGYANGDHMVKVGEKDEMSVNDLVKKHMEMCNEMEEMKKKNADSEDGGEPGMDDEDPAVENEDLDIDQMGDVGDRGGDKSLDNEEEEKEEKESKDKSDKMKNAKAKAKALRNAHLNKPNEEVARVHLSMDELDRGRALFGSSK